MPAKPSAIPIDKLVESWPPHLTHSAANRGDSLMPQTYSLPLDGTGRLAGDVQGDAVDARNLVDDAVAYLLQKIVR